MTINRQQIEQEAYRLWQQRGSPDGSSESDWLEAERQASDLHADNGKDRSSIVPTKDDELERNLTRDVHDVSHAK